MGSKKTDTGAVSDKQQITGDLRNRVLQYRDIPKSWIPPGPQQLRHALDETPVNELADSIRTRGILQPSIMAPFPEDREANRIVAGERGLQVASIARRQEIPL